MKITINSIETEVTAGETLLDTARRTGCRIPSLCFAAGARHKPSCMVCAVRDCISGQIIPSCATLPVEGMQIETCSNEVKTIRRLSLELLLSDHRADCEAPCSTVCPHRLDIEHLMHLYDSGRPAQAHALAVEASVTPAVCSGCRAPCEKTCRRGTVDSAVPIRTIIGELYEKHGTPAVPPPRDGAAAAADGRPFMSRIGRFTADEKERLRTVQTPSGCLHCACAGRSGCRLRRYASEAGIVRSRYGLSSAVPALQRVHVTGGMWFEPAKCIRCGLCVYNSSNGFTFSGRGFGMQVVIPDASRVHVDETLAQLCPTGALYVRS